MIKAKLKIRTNNGSYSIIIGTNFLNKLSKILKKMVSISINAFY